MRHVQPPWRIDRHAVLDSTQTTAIAAARDGEPGRLAVLADEQFAGRGSRGRNWVTPRGNLSLSILLRPSARPDPGYWALLAGVVLYETLARYAGGLMLKWPNDLLLNGGKLGGILIDTSLDATGAIEWVAIGVGANLAEAVHLDKRVTACLPPPGPDVGEVTEAFLVLWDRWAEADIRSAWLDRAHPAGTMIDVVTPIGRVRGRFAGLSPRGELLLEGGAAPVSSAEIFMSHAAEPPQIARCSSS